jgi:hypothetical protein
VTYRVGVSGPIAEWFPKHFAEPTLWCDAVGCDRVMLVRPVRGCAPAWLLNGTAPKGWIRHAQRGGATAAHTCPQCNRRANVDLKDEL